MAEFCATCFWAYKYSKQNGVRASKARKILKMFKKLPRRDY